MPTIIDLEKYDKDPLDLVKRHKDMVRDLRSNGIDGQEIRKILNDWHGLKMEVPISVTKRDVEKNRQINYAMRHVKALVSNEAIIDEEKEYLCKIYTRLEQKYVSWEKNKAGRAVIKLKRGKGTAKTNKQMIGRQVAAINKYILRFNKKLYLQNDVYDLIGEIFEVTDEQKYTRDQIKNFDKNNCYIPSILE